MNLSKIFWTAVEAVCTQMCMQMRSGGHVTVTKPPDQIIRVNTSHVFYFNALLIDQNDLNINKCDEKFEE